MFFGAAAADDYAAAERRAMLLFDAATFIFAMPLMPSADAAAAFHYLRFRFERLCRHTPPPPR